MSTDTRPHSPTEDTDPEARVAGPSSPERRALLADWRLAALLVIGLATAWGVSAGWWTPRGPLTSSEAIGSMVLSAAVGGVAGLVLRSRWAMALAPGVFAVAFEVTRQGVDGPTVDALHLSAYGIIAFATGRGFHALLTLAPMALGAALGAGLARSRARSAYGPRRRARIARRTAVGVSALALVALAVALARPATTAPIVGADGEPLPGSVAELTTVDLGGHDLGVMIRGTSTDNPVLLFLAGGPGGSELGAMRRHLTGLEESFTVVTWDQRGAGTSYAELDPTDTLNLEGYVADTIALTDYLRDRFDTDEIYLVGQSWGTTLGVLAVQQRPDLYRAFVGVGQMVSQRATDRIFYDDTLAWAERTGRDDLVEELEAAGPPPYDELFRYETALSHEQDVYPYDHRGNSEGAGQMSENLLVREYSLIDQVHVLSAFLDTFAAVYPQLQDIDFRESATDFEIPVFFVQGAHEARGRTELFEEWYRSIDAPLKNVVVLDTSGHRPLWEQPQEFVDYLVGTVLEQTNQR